MEDDEFDEKINKLLEKYGGLNAGLLGSFCWEESVGSVSKPRVLKYLNYLCRISGVMNKDFTIVGEEDVVRFLSWLERSDYSKWVKRDYKIALKRFFKWMNEGVEPSFTKRLSVL